MNAFWSLLAAIAFYTAIPLPLPATLEFRYVARWVPWVGLGLGLGAWGLDVALAAAGMPPWPRSTALVLMGLWLTGGLHLDGAMDTADGLAVTDPSRRLQVMSDSASGAFGVMAAIAILLLKITSLAAMGAGRGGVLLLAPILGRWSQQVAIVRYPYLKPTGKGAFHKQALPHPAYLMPGGLLLMAAVALVGRGQGQPWLWAMLGLGGGAIALMVPAWFQRQLGGQTGDTYGASVEWTEAIFLLWCVVWL